ncbi:MAG: class I SAM-dependent methyltransferase [Magnetococcus sp. WYHC-3]
MNFDAVRLRRWYDTGQGQTAFRILSEVIEPWVAEKSEGACVGLGYVQPWLEWLRPRRRLLWGVAPAEMGVIPWPGAGGNRMVQARPDALPFADRSVDRVFMVHLLEGSVAPNATLREVWRVLTPGGRLVLIVPNRSGLWARRDSTPWGWGRPFSPGQLEDLLEENLLLTRRSRYALFVPPWAGERLLAMASAWEKAGNRWFAPLGGVIACEAEKTVYAALPLRGTASVLHSARRLVMPLVEPRGRSTSSTTITRKYHDRSTAAASIPG